MNRTQTRQPRMLSPDVHATAFAEDVDARKKVYTMDAEVVQLKINSRDTFGLPKAEYVGDSPRKRDEHIRIAKLLGIDPEAFRDREGNVHTGARACTNMSRVRLGRLLEDMKAAGYKYVGGCWRQKKAPPGRRPPDPAVELTFAMGDKEVQMPEQIRNFLKNVWVDGFNHWANPKLDDQDQLYRLDTLNGFAGQPPGAQNANTGHNLRLDRNHYTGFNLE